MQTEFGFSVGGRTFLVQHLSTGAAQDALAVARRTRERPVCLCGLAPVAPELAIRRLRSGRLLLSRLPNDQANHARNCPFGADAHGGTSDASQPVAAETPLLEALWQAAGLCTWKPTYGRRTWASIYPALVATLATSRSRSFPVGPVWVPPPWSAEHPALAQAMFSQFVGRLADSSLPLHIVGMLKGVEDDGVAMISHLPSERFQLPARFSTLPYPTAVAMRYDCSNRTVSGCETLRLDQHSLTPIQSDRHLEFVTSLVARGEEFTTSLPFSSTRLPTRAVESRTNDSIRSPQLHR